MNNRNTIARAKAVVRSLPLFRFVEKLELQKILQIGILKSFSAGTTVLVQGKKVQNLYIILDGELTVSVNSNLVDSLKIIRGRIVGEVEYFNGMPSSASVVAKTKVEVFEINFEHLENLIKIHPKVGLEIHKGFVLDILGKLTSVTNHLMFLKLGDSQRIAHDIRSPLAALKVLSKKLGTNCDEEDHELLDLVVNRMEVIVSTLLSQEVMPGAISDLKQRSGASSNRKNSVGNLPSLVERIIREKKLQYKLDGSERGIQFEYDTAFSARYLKGEWSESELERIVSNIVDNSLDATRGEGPVGIRLRVERGRVVLSIKDNGCGIPKKVLSQIGTKKITFGKIDGHGLGLFHAFRKVEEWGGVLQIRSLRKKGTKVHIQLPLS